MDISESRMIAALLLLLGVSCLIVGSYTGQFDALVKLLKSVFPQFVLVKVELEEMITCAM